MKGDYLALSYYNRGNAYNFKGQYDTAIEDYDKSIQIDPNYASAYGNRGAAYGSKGQYDRAIEDYNKMIELDSNNAIPYGLRGNAYRSKEQYDRAIEDYNKAISLNPHGIHYSNRGLANWKIGDRNRAIADWQKACDLGNDYGCKTLEWALKNR